MGLDIYGYLVVKARSSKNEPLKSIQEYSDLIDERAKARFREFAKETLEKLENASEGTPEYEKIYNEDK